MGSKYLDVCYPTAELAQSEVCSRAQSSNMVGSDVYTSECESFTASTLVFKNQKNGVTTTSSTRAMPAFQSCAHDGGVGLSYDYFLACITVLCAVWGGKQLIKLFDQHHAES